MYKQLEVAYKQRSNFAHYCHCVGGSGARRDRHAHNQVDVVSRSREIFRCRLSTGGLLRMRGRCILRMGSGSILSSRLTEGRHDDSCNVKEMTILLQLQRKKLTQLTKLRLIHSAESTIACDKRCSAVRDYSSYPRN